MGYPQHLKSNGIKKPQQNTKKKEEEKISFRFQHDKIRMFS